MNKIKIRRHCASRDCTSGWIFVTPNDIYFLLTCFEDCRRLAHLFASLDFAYLRCFENALVTAFAGENPEVSWNEGGNNEPRRSSERSTLRESGAGSGTQ